MAQSCASLLFVSLLLLAIGNPRADATLIGTNAVGLNAIGQICCTQNGNCPGPAVVGAMVTLRCPSLFSGTVVVGQNTTDNTGSFNITAPLPAGVLPSLTSLCFVTSPLPLPGCTLPGTTGVLKGVLQRVGTFLTSTIGLVQALRVVSIIVLNI